MKRRRKQDAVILMAILVVLLSLWRLLEMGHRHGRMGAWAATNILGGSTLGLLAGSGQNGLAAGTSIGSSRNYPSSTVNTNTAAGIGSAQTNSVNTNVPITLIADADTVPAPPSIGTNVVDPATMEKRLGEAGAQGGDLQFSLFWRNINDLDLHCIDPANEEIFFQHRTSGRTGGELDVDQNAHLPYNSSPVENIYWPANGAPSGLYRIYVVFYADRTGGGTPFTVRTVVRGKTNFFSATIAYTGQRERNWICTLRYDPENSDADKRYLFLRQ